MHISKLSSVLDSSNIAKYLKNVIDSIFYSANGSWYLGSDSSYAIKQFWRRCINHGAMLSQQVSSQIIKGLVFKDSCQGLMMHSNCWRDCLLMCLISQWTQRLVSSNKWMRHSNAEHCFNVVVPEFTYLLDKFILYLMKTYQ